MLRITTVLHLENNTRILSSSLADAKNVALKFCPSFHSSISRPIFRLEWIDLDVHGTNLRPLFISQHWRGDGKWQMIIFIFRWRSDVTDQVVLFRVRCSAVHERFFNARTKVEILRWVGEVISANVFFSFDARGRGKRGRPRYRGARSCRRSSRCSVSFRVGENVALCRHHFFSPLRDEDAREAPPPRGPNSSTRSSP